MVFPPKNIALSITYTAPDTERPVHCTPIKGSTFRILLYDPPSLGLDEALAAIKRLAVRKIRYSFERSNETDSCSIAVWCTRFEARYLAFLSRLRLSAPSAARSGPSLFFFATNLRSSSRSGGSGGRFLVCLAAQAASEKVGSRASRQSVRLAGIVFVRFNEPEITKVGGSKDFDSTLDSAGA